MLLCFFIYLRLLLFIYFFYLFSTFLLFLLIISCFVLCFSFLLFLLLVLNICIFFLFLHVCIFFLVINSLILDYFFMFFLSTLRANLVFSSTFTLSLISTPKMHKISLPSASTASVSLSLLGIFLSIR